MKTRRVIQTVESHTEGMPTRVVTGGIPALPGRTMAERRRWVMEHDEIRTMLMFEPRGHSAMSGAILQPSTRDDADFGVVYIEVTGCLPMCGHGTMGVATVLVETGLVEAIAPVTRIRLDTPAGLVTVDVAVGADGSAESVTLTNVASYCDELDATVEVPGLGTITYDMAYGGNFYAILGAEALGIPFDRAEKSRLSDAALAIMDAINEQNRPVHPEDAEISGCHHVQFLELGSSAVRSRNAMAIYPGWFDRSPCGTGTSARMAQLHARGELALNTDFVNESFIGTRFIGRLIGETTVAGRPAVLPTVTGHAWITGTAQWFVDPTDPFPAGFLF